MRKGEICVDATLIALLKAGRTGARWSRERLAEESGVSVSVIQKIERHAKDEANVPFAPGSVASRVFVRSETILKMLQALRRGGVEFAMGQDNVQVIFHSRADARDFLGYAAEIMRRMEEHTDM